MNTNKIKGGLSLLLAAFMCFSLVSITWAAQKPPAKKQSVSKMNVYHKKVANYHKAIGKMSCANGGCGNKLVRKPVGPIKHFPQVDLVNGKRMPDLIKENSIGKHPVGLDPTLKPSPKLGDRDPSLGVVTSNGKTAAAAAKSPQIGSLNNIKDNITDLRGKTGAAAVLNSNNPAISKAISLPPSTINGQPVSGSSLTKGSNIVSGQGKTAKLVKEANWKSSAPKAGKTSENPKDTPSQKQQWETNYCSTNPAYCTGGHIDDNKVYKAGGDSGCRYGHQYCPVQPNLASSSPANQPTIGTSEAHAPLPRPTIGTSGADAPLPGLSITSYPLILPITDPGYIPNGSFAPCAGDGCYLPVQDLLPDGGVGGATVVKPTKIPYQCADPTTGVHQNGNETSVSIPIVGDICYDAGTGAGGIHVGVGFSAGGGFSDFFNPWYDPSPGVSGTGFTFDQNGITTASVGGIDGFIPLGTVTVDKTLEAYYTDPTGLTTWDGGKVNSTAGEDKPLFGAQPLLSPSNLSPSNLSSDLRF